MSVRSHPCARWKSLLVHLHLPIMAGYLRLLHLHRPKPPFPAPLRLFSHKTPTSRPPPPNPRPPVAVFWDLDNKPPTSIPPTDAARRLHLAAASLGPVRFTVAYANHHAFRHIPAPVLAARRRARSLAPSRPAPALCRVCGRAFHNRDALLPHFHLHRLEHEKRLRRIASARGARRVALVAKSALKIKKYNLAAADLILPSAGYGLADQLRRAGVTVREVDNEPEAADRALREHMMDTMDKGRVGCLMLVSDDSGFLPVLREARRRCLWTVVVGDERDGALKRVADTSYSWEEVKSGKARKEAASAVGKWNDKDLLKGLEWRYKPEVDGEEFGEFEGVGEGELAGEGGCREWWKLDSCLGKRSERGHQDERGEIARVWSSSC